MLSALVRSIVIPIKDVVIKPKNVIHDCIFMMRMGYSVLKGLNGGKYSVINLRENE